MFLFCSRLFQVSLRQFSEAVALKLSFRLNCSVLPYNSATRSITYEMKAAGVMDDAIYISTNDKKSYKVITLDNGLKALLIADVINQCDGDDDLGWTTASEGSDDEMDVSDEDVSENEIEDVDEHDKKKTNLAAASLCIGVGSFYDPDDLPGLAHFLEHMVFMGSEKYPDENYSDAFIYKHGGSANAFTDCERTVFKMELPPSHFKEALDIFAQCFASPLLRVESMDREIQAVDSEFQLITPVDCHRKSLLFGMLAKEGHPMSKFMWGNLKTLKDIPMENNIDVNSRLKQFYKRYYSAQYMTLAVQSIESLETLENWVRETFSAIPNNGLPLETFGSLSDPFKSEKFNKLYKVIPVKKYHEVVINWALPPQKENYKEKALHYIGGLVGDEGKGSILALLKKRSWAINLMAGNDGSGFDENSTYSLFNIDIVLTESGIKHIYEILVLVFQYLEMLRREGPQEQLYNEHSDIRAIDFRFKEETDSLEYVEAISENMQRFPPIHYLSGDDLYFEYHEKLIKECQDALTVDNANIMILSSHYTKDTECTEVEKWTQCNYSCNDIPKEWIEKLKDLETNPLLHLPESNMFIPSDFDLKHQEEPVNKYPVKIFEDQQSCIWYKEDIEFRVPKAYIYLHFISPVCQSTASNAAMMDLFNSLIHHTLTEVVYPATVANLSYSIYNTHSGFTIKVYGLNDKLYLLLEAIVNHIANYEVDENMFQSIKKHLSESYYNSFIKPGKLCQDLRKSILQNVFWTSIDKRKALQAITSEMLKTFIQQCFSSVFMEGLVQGNITKEEALLVDKLIKDTFKPTPLSPDEFPKHCVMNVPEGSSICRVISFNTEDKNSVISNYYQAGPGSIKTSCMLELLVAKMTEPCFDTLRTHEQLGYDISCLEKINYGILGFVISIHSPSKKFSSSHVDLRIEEFLDKFCLDILDLCQERFETQLMGMIEWKKCKDLHMEEEVNRNWGEITSHEYVFDRLSKEIDFLRSISLEEFISWVISNILPAANKRKKLGLQIVCPYEKCVDEPKNSSAEINEKNMVLQKADPDYVYNLEHMSDLEKTSNVQFIDNICKYKDNAPFFPQCKIIS